MSSLEDSKPPSGRESRSRRKKRLQAQHILPLLVAEAVPCCRGGSAYDEKTRGNARRAREPRPERRVVEEEGGLPQTQQQQQQQQDDGGRRNNDNDDEEHHPRGGARSGDKEAAEAEDKAKRGEENAGHTSSNWPAERRETGGGTAAASERGPSDDDAGTDDDYDATSSTFRPTPRPTTSRPTTATPSLTADWSSDFSALSALYWSTGGGAGKWINAREWMSGLPCTNGWYGVSCGMHTHKEVTMGLRLGFNGLSGTLPSQIGSLSNITQEFRIDSSHLVGTVPSQIGRLSAMKLGLYLASNSLEGTIPTEIGQVSFLKAGIALDVNRFTGSIPSQVGGLSTAIGIGGSRNSLTGTLPSQLGHMLHAIGLEIVSNCLTGSIPTQIGQLKHAADAGVALHYNDLVGTIPTEIGMLTKMRGGIILEINDLVGTIPTEIGMLTNIIAGMDIELNMITGAIPTQIGGLSHMTSGFSVNDNSLAGPLPSQIGRLTALTSSFWLQYSSLTGPIPTQIGLLSAMESTFKLSNNRLTGPIPTQIGLLSAMENDFDLSSNRLTGPIPTQIGLLSTMTHYFYPFHSNRLYGSLPTQLARVTGVSQLYTFSNSLDGTVPSEIGSMTKLIQIFLQSNNLEGSLPSQIGAIGTTLQSLVLDENRLDSPLPASTCNLTGLVLFSASSNGFSGRVPRCLRLPEVEVFNIASNHFTGVLPSVRGWGELSYLLLHSNSFTGGVASLALNGSVVSDWEHDRPFDDNFYDYLGGNLIAVTLHQNSLDQRLPWNLVLPSTLEYFTINNNQIPGKVPRRLLSQLNQNQNQTNKKNMTLLLSNNRLSCNLPASWMLRLDKSSLVLVGNLFSATLPSWVPEEEANSPFLSTVIRPRWQSLALPQWLDLLLQFAGVVTITAVGLWFINRKRPRSSPLLASSRLVGPSTAARPYLYLKECAKITTGLATAAVVCLVPVFVLGGKYFECGDAMMKYSTIAYLADSPGLEGLAAGLLAAYTLGLSIVLSHFVPSAVEEMGMGSGKRGMLLLEGGDGEKSSSGGLLYEPLLSGGEGGGGEEEKTSGATTAVEGIHAAAEDGGEEEEKEMSFSNNGRSQPIDTRRPLATDSTSDASPQKPLRAALYGLAWLSCLVIVGGMPTVLYVMTYSLPSENSMASRVPPQFRSYVGSVLSQGLALYLAFFSSVILPRVTAFTTRKMIALLRKGGDQHKTQTVLAIVARTLLIVVVPMVAVVIFNDGCYGGWMKLWKPCSNGDGGDGDAVNGFFNKLVTVEYYQFLNRFGVPYYGTIELSLVKRESICAPSYQRGTCARSMLGVLGPLLLKKMVYAILLSALEPLASWASRRFRRWRGRPEELSNEQQPPPDPMLRLVWFETALVFGALVPLLVPLLALQLHTDACVFAWALRRVSPRSGEPHQAPLPVQRGAMQAHSVIVLGLHSFLVIFFFVDNALNGAAGLAVAVSVNWVAYLIAVGWRMSILNFLRRRCEKLVCRVQ